MTTGKAYIVKEKKQYDGYNKAIRTATINDGYRFPYDIIKILYKP